MSKRRPRGGRTAPQPWEPLTEREITPSMAAVLAEHGWPPDTYRVFRNNRYQVHVRGMQNDAIAAAGIPGGRILHLSIKRVDRGPIVRDWRIIQRIKNEIVGEECEAVEIYPAESRLVDEANQYHLWAVPEPGYRFPFGFHERLVGDDLDPAVDDDLAPTVELRSDRARQRRFDR